MPEEEFSGEDRGEVARKVWAFAAWFARGCWGSVVAFRFADSGYRFGCSVAPFAASSTIPCL